MVSLHVNMGVDGGVQVPRIEVNGRETTVLAHKVPINEFS